MLNRKLNKRVFKTTSMALVVMAATGFGAFAGLVASQYMVSQKGREFAPRNVTINRGEAVMIINDDADLRHHAYIDSEKFKFDSGDQEPGSKVNIVFPAAGKFEVLCAIHPKMKLVVEVK